MSDTDRVRRRARLELIAPIAVLLLVGGTDTFAQYRLTARRERTEAAIAARTEAIGDRELLAASQRVRLVVERARELPSAKAPLHLAIALTDGQLTLERGDASLASAAVEIGEPGWRRVGEDSVFLKAPRGLHRVSTITAEAITLEGGWQLRGDAGSATIGVLRLSARDFSAVRPNVTPGIAVYIF